MIPLSLSRVVATSWRGMLPGGFQIVFNGKEFDRSSLMALKRLQKVDQVSFFLLVEAQTEVGVVVFHNIE